MKKIKSKLRLDRETVKVLQNDSLDGVAGGTTLPTFMCPTHTCATVCMMSACSPTACLTKLNCQKG